MSLRTTPSFVLAGIRVEASGDITVQAGSINTLTSDGFLALPRTALGQEYYVMSYHYTATSMFHQGPSQFGIVGASDDTRVTILLPESDPGIRFTPWTYERVERDGRTLTLTIHAYESLQVISVTVCASEVTIGKFTTSVVS